MSGRLVASNGTLYGLGGTTGAQGQPQLTLFRVSAFSPNPLSITLPPGSQLLSASGYRDLVGIKPGAGGDTDIFRITSTTQFFSGGYTETTYSISTIAQAGSPVGTPTCLVEGSDGTLYGLSRDGGSAGQGAFFRVRAGTTAPEVLLEFGGSRGAFPKPSLAWGSDGKLYGVTAGVAPGGDGAFRIATDGTFEQLAIDPSVSSLSGFTANSAGELYGVTAAGGTYGLGAVVRANADGTVTPTTSFDPYGRNPVGPLVPDGQGNFYCITTHSGPLNDRGVIYKLGTDDNVSVVAELPAAAGAGPRAGLTAGADGALYGTTSSGGASNCGTVFRASLSGEVTVLDDLPPGSASTSRLMLASDGLLYGTRYDFSVYQRDVVFKIGADGRVAFVAEVPATAGASPQGVLVEGPDHALYGTTLTGGEFGWGAIFRVTTAGEASTVASFSETGSAAVGAGSREAVLGPDGALYVAGYYGPLFRWAFTGQPERVTTLDKFAAAPLFLDGRMYVPGANASYYAHSVYAYSIPSYVAKPLSTYGIGLGPHSPVVARGATLYGLTMEGHGFLYSEALLPNQPPVAQSGSYAVYSGPMVLPISAATTDADGDKLSVLSVSTPAQGDVAIDSDGKLTYTARPGFSGSDEFSFTITDGHGGSSTAKVSIYNTIPSVPGIVNLYARNGSIRCDLWEKVFDRDSGQTLTFTPETRPSFGTIKLEGTVLTYTPREGFDHEEIRFAVDDGFGGKAELLVRIFDVPRFGVGNYFGTLRTSDLEWDKDLAGTNIRATVSASGAFSMTNISGPPIRGVFDVAGHYRGTITIAGKLYQVELQLEPNALSITGSLTPASGKGFEIELGHQSYSATRAAPQAGRYTFAITGGIIYYAVKDLGNEYGRGFGTMQITSEGHVQLAGRLSDGGAWSAGGVLYSGGSCTFSGAVSYPTGFVRGAVKGDFTLAEYLYLDGRGHVHYHRQVALVGTPESPRPPSYDILQSIYISRLTPSLPPLTLGGSGQTELHFYGGGLDGLVESLRPAGQFGLQSEAGSTSGVTLGINPKTGLFAGTLRMPRATRSIAGAILQKANVGIGSVTLPKGYGGVLLGPVSGAPK